MRRVGTILMAVISLVGIGSAQTGKLAYPPARRVDQTDTYYGVRVADPYRWLEAMESDETRSWVKSQDALTESFLAAVPAREAIRRRLARLQNFDVYGLPTKENGRYFFTKAKAGTSHAVLCVQEGVGGAERVVFDVSARFPDEEWRLAGFAPSPDGRLVACAVARGQSRWQEVRIVGADGRDERPDHLTGLHNIGGGVSWSRDGLGFYYVRFEPPRVGADLGATVENGRVYYHRLGESQARDTLVFESPERPNRLLTTQVTEDGRYLVLTVREGSSVTNAVFYRDLRDPKGALVPLLEDDAAYTFLGNEGPLFWFYTNQNALNGRIVAVDTRRPKRSDWTEVVPEAEETIAGGSLVGGNAVAVAGDRFVALYWKDARPLVRVFDRKGRLAHEIELPAGGSIWNGFGASQRDGEVFYRFLGLTAPSLVVRLDAISGKTTVFRRAEADFDPEGYVTTQVFYRSKDGTRVPMFLAHKKGIRLDGRNPTLMYAYGAFGWNSFLFYQPHVLAWLEMGGVYAQPCIRGGGEYGEAWHRAGMGVKEQNSIDDYIAAAEWLVASGYTSPARLAANGGSASGALAGAAIVQRPDLFGAAVVDIPVLDMLRFDRFTTAKYWIQEFGSTEKPEEFKSLRAHSPYHNVAPGACHPPTLVLVGERDEVAVPVHGYKFVAAMQAAQLCEKPVLLKVMWGAGHNFGTTPEQTIDSRAAQLAFLVRVFGLDAGRH